METKKDVGALLLAYPTCWLSHSLDQDKQLEIAHVVRYCNGIPSLQITVQGGMDCIQYTQSERSSCVIFWS